MWTPKIRRRRARAKALFDEDKAELARLLNQFADALVSDDRDRRLMDDFRSLSREYILGAEGVMAMADAGQRTGAIAMLIGPLADIGARLSESSDAWIQHNGSLSAEAGQATTGALTDAQRGLLVAVGFALVVRGAWPADVPQHRSPDPGTREDRQVRRRWRLC